MSTYLQICADLRREASISGTGPAAVTNQTGQYLDVINWVKQAWMDIQGRHTNWRWLRSTFSINTVADDDTYAGTDCTDTIAAAVITRFSHWWPRDEDGGPNVKAYLSASGVAVEGWLTFLPWSTFRGVYRIGTQTSGPPVHYTIDPQNNLVLGPKPNAVYVVSGEYQKSGQVLAANADLPEMPAQFHDLIWCEALRSYAYKQAAPESLTRAIARGNKLMRQLETNQLPEWGTGGPLA